MKYKQKILKRTNLNLTEDEYKLLQDEANRRGLSASEILRRAVDNYFEHGINLKANNEPTTNL
jgi:hypothetical protein